MAPRNICIWWVPNQITLRNLRPLPGFHPLNPVLLRSPDGRTVCVWSIEGWLTAHTSRYPTVPLSRKGSASSSHRTQATAIAELGVAHVLFHIGLNEHESWWHHAGKRFFDHPAACLANLLRKNEPAHTSLKLLETAACKIKPRALHKREISPRCSR